MKKEGKTTRNRNCRYNKAYNRMKKRKDRITNQEKMQKANIKLEGKAQKKTT